MARNAPAFSPPIHAAQYVRMSTDHQRYSIDNQIDAIREFAEAGGYRVVKTYADAGKSGLTLKGRTGLKQLLADVEGGSAIFSSLLVYDVSRWGRFQDPDEAAAYEFLCRSRGVEVIYCAEPFDQTGGAYNSIVKNMKRNMAAEFSRDQSAKVFRAQRRVAELGFWVGSTPPYGYERWAVNPANGAELRLARGEHKGVSSHRTVLRPGPPEEVAMVRRAFRLLVEHGRTPGQIARVFNAEGWRTRRDLPWNDARVRALLRNERYIGVTTYGATFRNLQAKARSLAPVRVEGGTEPLIERRAFIRAQAILSRKRPGPLAWTDAQMLAGLEELRAKHGGVTTDLIRLTKSLPSYDSYVRRFGSLAGAFELISVPRANPHVWGDHRRRLRGIRTTLIGQVRLELAAGGLDSEIAGEGIVQCGGARVAVCLSQPTNKKAWWMWRGRIQADWFIGVRMTDGYGEVLDCLVFKDPDKAAVRFGLGERGALAGTSVRLPSVDAAGAFLARRLVPATAASPSGPPSSL